MNSNNLIHLVFSIELLDNYKYELISSLPRKIFLPKFQPKRDPEKNPERRVLYNEALGPLFIVPRGYYMINNTGDRGLVHNYWVVEIRVHLPMMMRSWVFSLFLWIVVNDARLKPSGKR